MGGQGRNNNSGTQQTGVNQTASLRISDIKRNYNYPEWFENTMGFFRAGTITSQAFESAFSNLANQKVITLKTSGSSYRPTRTPTRTPTPTPTPTRTPTPSGGYNRPSFEHDSDEWGYDYLYGERDFQSDEDIWKRFSEDLTRHEEQEGRLSDAHAHRLTIEEKVNNAKAEHQKIWDSISTLHTKHTKQEDRISQKSGIGHTHAGGGEEKEDCGWFGEKCWFKTPDFDLGWLKWLGLAIGAGLLLWLIRPLFKIGANLTK